MGFPHLPILTAFYDADYEKNFKGSNYWANRVRRVAKDYKGKLAFAVASHTEYAREMADLGLKWSSGDKPKIAVQEGNGRKYVMEEEFSPEALGKFIEEYLAGNIEPYVKSEPLPEDNSGPVTTIVGK